MKYDDLSITILSKMVFAGVIGGKHTSSESIQKGFPSHQKGDVDKALKKLVKLNLVLYHPTSYGMQYSLNPKMLEEIKRLVEGFT
ncbi:MAG: hypothetical protein QXW37_07915 [Candidatus Nitrosotenuis sp.]